MLAKASASLTTSLLKSFTASAPSLNTSTTAAPVSPILPTTSSTPVIPCRYASPKSLNPSTASPLNILDKALPANPKAFILLITWFCIVSPIALNTSSILSSLILVKLSTTVLPNEAITVVILSVTLPRAAIITLSLNAPSSVLLK